MSAPTSVPAASWDRIRTSYMAEWPSVTFTALAEEHEVSRHSIARRAKRERWAFHARIACAEKMERRAAEALAFSRRQSVEIASAIRGYATDKHVSLEQLAAEAKEAHSAVWHVAHDAHWYADACRELADAKADRPRNYGTPALRELTRPEWGAVGRWPEYGAPTRKPFPWEKRRRAA